MKNVKDAVALILLWSVIAGAIVACVCGTKDKDYANADSIPYQHPAQGTVVKMCLEGHSYYRWMWGSESTGIASVLHDDGTPVKCWSGPIGVIEQGTHVKAEQQE